MQVPADALLGKKAGGVGARGEGLADGGVLDRPVAALLGVRAVRLPQANPRCKNGEQLSPSAPHPRGPDARGSPPPGRRRWPRAASVAAGLFPAPRFPAGDRSSGRGQEGARARGGAAAIGELGEAGRTLRLRGGEIGNWGELRGGEVCLFCKGGFGRKGRERGGSEISDFIQFVYVFFCK